MTHSVLGMIATHTPYTTHLYLNGDSSLMKICPTCGNRVADSHRFCYHCGYDFQTGRVSVKHAKASKIKSGGSKIKHVKHTRALPQAQATPSPPPSMPEIVDYRAKAEDAYVRGDYFSALQYYKLAHDNDPNNLDIILARLKLLEMLNRKEEALQCYEEALRLKPEDRDLWRAKSRLLLLLYHEKDDFRLKKAAEEAEERAKELEEKMISQGICPTCDGSGVCPKCHGTGHCHECGGTGVYKGVVKCQFCNGTGKCSLCGGTGKCPDCSGTGKLEMVECVNCGGSGVCPKCHGTGKGLIGKCKECSGTGYCNICHGKGKVVKLPSHI